MGGPNTGASLGDVYFELIAVGATMRVTAIHAATGIEVVALGPVTAARADLERLALQKLRRRLERDGPAPS